MIPGNLYKIASSFDKRSITFFSYDNKIIQKHDAFELLEEVKDVESW